MVFVHLGVRRMGAFQQAGPHPQEYGDAHRGPATIDSSSASGIRFIAPRAPTPNVAPRYPANSRMYPSDKVPMSNSSLFKGSGSTSSSPLLRTYSTRPNTLFVRSS